MSRSSTLRAVSVDGLAFMETGLQPLLLGTWVLASLAIAGATVRFGEAR
jgi:hypothetical protein